VRTYIWSLFGSKNYLNHGNPNHSTVKAPQDFDRRRYLDSTLDFIGHIGGDDFLFVFQSEDWHMRLKNGIAAFNLAAMKLYDESAIQAGGIEGEDRDGAKRFFPMTTLYAGVVHAGNGAYKSASEVSEAASTARQLAKKGGVNVHIQEAAARLSNWPKI
jgi:GGDEF domain-containing protein